MLLLLRVSIQRKGMDKDKRRVPKGTFGVGAEEPSGLV